MNSAPGRMDVKLREDYSVVYPRPKARRLGYGHLF
jgi:hypothetical protein